MPGRGGGGSGGRGGSGGNASRKRKRETESQDEKTARRKVANDKQAQRTPEQREAINKRSRDKYRLVISVQEAIHLLLAHLFPVCAELMDEQKRDIDNFLGAVNTASYIAADQSKAMSMQIQFARPGEEEIMKETRGTTWRNKLSAFGADFGLIQVCQCTFTNLHPNSPGHTHQLETHAQRTMIDLASRDPQSTLYQFYNASAARHGGMSVLRAKHLCDGAYRVLVITATLWAKDPSRSDIGSFEDPFMLDSHTDDVFGIDAFAVRLILL